MATRTVQTYCRICEPECGLTATVEDGRLVSVRGDRDHVHSRGFVCTKAQAMVDVTYDSDRVLTPLKRVGGPGEFEPVSWDEALSDIAERLGAIRDRHGRESVATFGGNPPAFSYATGLGHAGFKQALGVRWSYSINSEDAAARLAANALLYGSVGLLPKPDLWRTDFALILGANPYVSKGSLFSEPQCREALDGIVARGGRVVVIDPRRTETARRYEHMPVRSGTDAFLLLGVLHVLTVEGLSDREFLVEHCAGHEELESVLRSVDLERCAASCRVPADHIRSLARSFASASSGLVYGRTGTCTQQFGTLNNVLQDLVVILTGNLEKAGGLLFGWGPIDFLTHVERAGLATYGKKPSRTTGLPEVAGLLPSTALASDITTPGEGQVRALATIGCNPVVTSAGGGPELATALEELDLHFSLDLYVNETNRYAHYVLPVTGMFEREDIPLVSLGLMLRPSIWATEAVIARQGDTRQEFEILDEIVRRMGLGGAYTAAPLRWLAKRGVRPSPRTLADLAVRTSAAGDWFGLRRSGVSFAKLVKHHPHGLTLREELPTGQLTKQLRTSDKKVHVWSPDLTAEVGRLRAQESIDELYPLRLCGMREVRSHNSWMHNVERLMPDSRAQHALMSPDDAHALGFVDGGWAIITSAAGSVKVPVQVTEDMTAGNVALPHGWGHDGGWQRANAAGGVNSNVLASSAVQDIEPLAAMSVLNGIPIRVDRA